MLPSNENRPGGSVADLGMFGAAPERAMPRVSCSAKAVRSVTGCESVAQGTGQHHAHPLVLLPHRPHLLLSPLLNSGVGRP